MPRRPTARSATTAPSSTAKAKGKAKAKATSSTNKAAGAKGKAVVSLARSIESATSAAEAEETSRIVESEVEEEDVEEEDDDDDQSPAQAPPRHKKRQRPAVPAQESERAKIPPRLLLSIMQRSFTEPNTRISDAASKATGSYLETFTREVVARAAAGCTTEGDVRSDASAREAVVAGKGGWLEVEDLEKLAPQLLLDF